jgi:hypothetical protein
MALLHTWDQRLGPHFHLDTPPPGEVGRSAEMEIGDWGIRNRPFFTPAAIPQSPVCEVRRTDTSIEAGGKGIALASDPEEVRRHFGTCRHRHRHRHRHRGRESVSVSVSVSASEWKSIPIPDARSPIPDPDARSRSRFPTPDPRSRFPIPTPDPDADADADSGQGGGARKGGPGRAVGPRTRGSQKL